MEDINTIEAVYGSYGPKMRPLEKYRRTVNAFRDKLLIKYYLCVMDKTVWTQAVADLHIDKFDNTGFREWNCYSDNRN